MSGTPQAQTHGRVRGPTSVPGRLGPILTRAQTGSLWDQNLLVINATTAGGGQTGSGTSGFRLGCWSPHFPEHLTRSQPDGTANSGGAQRPVSFLVWPETPLVPVPALLVALKKLLRDGTLEPESDHRHCICRAPRCPGPLGPAPNTHSPCHWHHFGGCPVLTPTTSSLALGSSGPPFLGVACLSGSWGPLVCLHGRPQP